MNEKQTAIYQKLQAAFRQMIEEKGLDPDEQVIAARGLSPEEAIGITERKDYPILNGKEIMLQADFKGSLGQSFTDHPSVLTCSLRDVMAWDIYNDARSRALFIAILNAVMRHLSLCCKTIHCKNNEPPECAEEYIPWMEERYPGAKLTLVGYQPALFSRLSKSSFAPHMRVLDLNPENIGHRKFGILVEDGIRDYQDAVLNWPDVILCTSSVFGNGTCDLYVDIGKEVWFYGTTGAGAVELLGLNRHCPLSK